jgi:hypothetical protein
VQISPPIVETMYRKLGGRQVLGEEVTSESLTHKDVITFKSLRSVWSGGGYGR